jgi:hypothetical protein
MKRKTWYFAGQSPFLAIFRVPWPMPRWDEILKAITPVMQSRGFRRKDFQVTGILPFPQNRFAEEWTSENVRFADLLDRMYDEDEELRRTVLPAFDLYEWQGGRFVLRRGASVT